MEKAPQIDKRTQEKLKDEALDLYLAMPKSVSECWFEAVWNEIQRMGFEIKKKKEECLK